MGTPVKVLHNNNISCVALLTGTGGQGPRVWDLGPGLARVDVLHARHHAPAGALAGQPALAAV